MSSLDGISDEEVVSDPEGMGAGDATNFSSTGSNVKDELDEDDDDDDEDSCEEEDSFEPTPPPSKRLKMQGAGGSSSGSSPERHSMAKGAQGR